MKFKINKEKTNLFEIGVGDTFCSKSLQYWGNNNINITLFEPNPILYKSLLKKTKDINNIKLYNIGIFNQEKIGKLVCAGVLSYIKDIPSPINSICLNRLNEIFINTTELGYGHAEEMVYSLFHRKEFYEKEYLILLINLLKFHQNLSIRIEFPFLYNDESR